MSIELLITFFWSLRIISNFLSYIQLWYVKEYRFDRMRIHLRTNQGKKILFLPFRRPPITIKTALIFVLGACGMYGIYIVLPFSGLIKLLSLDILTFPLSALLVFIFKIPTHLYHTWEIKQAVTLLRAHKKMHVIGITGSYGKTSTKEFLATILSQSYATLKTEASKNSPVGIAELVLQKLSPSHRAFVVEMGAYMKGEIAQMSDMVHPSVAIVTAINPQHQDLFGSIENTIAAKYELIAGLTGEKKVILNFDNPHTRTMGDRAQQEGCTVIFYSVLQKADWYATEIQQLEDSISFVAHFQKKQAQVTVPILGTYQVSNILAALAASVACDLSFETAVEACSSLSSFQKTMQRVASTMGAQCIDDTFNNNPDAAIAALTYLQTRKGKKIFVFQPMIELGVYAKESHERVGAFASEVCDEIILTNDNYYDFFMSGVHKNKTDANVQVLSGGEAASYIKNHVGIGDTVLFKGKEASRVLKAVQ